MAEMLFGAGDCGGTQNRVAVFDAEMRLIGREDAPTNPHNYYETVEYIATTMQHLAAGNGELVSASLAIAAQIDDEGVIRQAGTLTPWKGRNFGADVAGALGLPPARVGSMGDMEAAATSQQYINEQNGQPADGVVLTLSSGWGGAKYYQTGRIEADEPGHQFLRKGAVCSCGTEGCAEAFISGNGVRLNQNQPMETYLLNPLAADVFVNDVTTAVSQLVERYAATGFHPEELRWMGGVATGQPLLMRRAAEAVQYRLGNQLLAWDTVSMGSQAGLHGAFIAAQHRAKVW